MKYKFKNNFSGYFKFYRGIIGYRIYVNLALCVFVSLLDGLGLSMFIPLLKYSEDSSSTASSEESMGQIAHVMEFIKSSGIPITLGTILLMLLTLFAFKGIMRFIQQMYQTKIRHIFIRRVRYDLLKNLKGLSYEGFLSLDAGKIQNSLITEVDRLFQTLTMYFTAAQNAIILLTYILLAFVANWQFAILVAIGAGISNLFFRKLYKATKKASVTLSQKGHFFNSALIQSINYFKYLKATNYFEVFANKLKKTIDERENLNSKMGYYTSISVAAKEPIVIAIVVIIIYAQISWMGGSLGPILLSLLLFYRALTYLMSIQNNWQSFIQNVGALETVSSFFNEMEARQESEEGTKFTTIQNSIILDDVSFSYGSTKVLDHLNIEIRKNETIALIGESGSGKTTLANMIAGLLKPQSGNILVDGSSINNYNINSFRSRIGYISQEPAIFNDTIFNNITFWDEPTEENKKHFFHAVALASLSEFIDKQELKEDTPLGDNGILISGGQKQRISIARELYKKIDILILDEATSALDSETEHLIQKNIEMLHGNYTMVVIAHRLSTIKNADKIYLLENGSVSAVGTFNELLTQSSKFKRMVALQEF